jgi:hypothetical protein
MGNSSTENRHLVHGLTNPAGAHLALTKTLEGNSVLEAIRERLERSAPQDATTSLADTTSTPSTAKEGWA